ncbi:hypothetical protein C6495_04385 [Candidatus Poribacteria bacterium]|nr:MAG: hypothetical protein C6495_04385 [Candidatus Poribacteria bacterium]
MAYSSFTLDKVIETFELDIVDSEELFGKVEPMVLGHHLNTALERKVQLAEAINTEKARSELIVAEVLVELREQFDRRISLFSGIDFNVDAGDGLVGICDFLVSLSPVQYLLQAPIIALVEAKRDDFLSGLGQCTAEMLAAQRFNARKGNDIPTIYGVSTTGLTWKCLKLTEKRLYIDTASYAIRECDKILGILVSMVAQKG